MAPIMFRFAGMTGVEANRFCSLLRRNRRFLRHEVLLIALCGVLYFPYLDRLPFFDKGEPREAITVLDIVERGDWLVPLRRATEIPSKPPLFHWSAAVTSLITGRLNEATVRFPSALYATLGVVLVYALGGAIFDAEVSLLGGAVLATTLVYENQALSARVDMTLCFFVTLGLVLFYWLYRGVLKNQSWYYIFYAVVGIGALAKGPLGIVLPALVAAVFLLLKRRWDALVKFCFHPGVVLMLVLAVGWYGIAVMRCGEHFFDHQILKESLSRFVGGSGHSHPFYFYMPNLFVMGLPWSLFFPFLLWDSFKKPLPSDDGELFLKLWFLVMFVFFSLSMGKRPVYLLPLYPAASLLSAAWLYNYDGNCGARLVLYRIVAVVAGLLGVGFLLVTLGAMRGTDLGWLFSSIEGFLRTKDRVNLVMVERSAPGLGWPFSLACLVVSMLWLSMAHCFWGRHLRAGALRLVMISVVLAFPARAIVMPVIANAKSYRSFMEEVSRHVAPGAQLYLYGDSFDSDSVVFYRGRPIEVVHHPFGVASTVGPGREYIIMSEQLWRDLQHRNYKMPGVILRSKGTGPESDAPLVLVRGSGVAQDEKKPSSASPPSDKGEAAPAGDSSTVASGCRK
jgi:4-amino-4-deoxy-L-arabinose transferase-like glycosyltransferase